MKSKEKLQAAAWRIFAEKGFENTTVQEIAAAAAVTERTFFRQFKDKSDVLFDSENHLGQQVASFISSNLTKIENPVELAVKGFASLILFDEQAEMVAARNKIIHENPDLLERELLKQETLIESIAAALSVKFDEEISQLTARISVQIFHLAFQKFVSGSDMSYVACVREVFGDYQKLIEENFKIRDKM